MAAEQDHVQLPVPAPFVFTGHLIAALVLHWVVPLSIPWRLESRLVGAVLVVLGLWLGFAAISRMRRAHTSVDPRQPVTALVTDGPFARTRNPIYLGFFLIYFGLTFLAGTLWGLLLSPFLLRTINRVIVRSEEEYLAGKFKDQYAQYMARVRKWL